MLKLDVITLDMMRLCESMVLEKRMIMEKDLPICVPQITLS